MTDLILHARLNHAIFLPFDGHHLPLRRDRRYVYYSGCMDGFLGDDRGVSENLGFGGYGRRKGHTRAEQAIQLVPPDQLHAV